MHYKCWHIGSVLQKAWWWLSTVETCCLKCNYIIKLLCLTGICILYVFGKHNGMTNVKLKKNFRFVCRKIYKIQYVTNVPTIYVLKWLYTRYLFFTWAGLAQSVQRITTGWTVRGSNLCGGKIFLTRQGRPWGPPSLLYNWYWVFPEGYRRSIAIYLLPLSAFVASYRATLTFNVLIFYRHYLRFPSSRVRCHLFVCGHMLVRINNPCSVT